MLWVVYRYQTNPEQRFCSLKTIYNIGTPSRAMESSGELKSVQFYFSTNEEGNYFEFVREAMLYKSLDYETSSELDISR